MANEVYANGREIACKAAAGKTTAAFPDTCLSPPSPPAGPVPIPYPNTAYASDTSNGSTTVMISGQEVMLKDKSVFKKSTGNEAATKSLGMGVVTHTIQGEASFTAWSMDVKIEGQNVDRHLDMTVNNEQCLPADTPPWPYIDNAASGADSPCNKPAPKDYANQVSQDCPPPAHSRVRRGFSGGKLVNEPAPGPQQNSSAKCCEARKCMMVQEKPNTCKGCGKTPHHVVPAAEFLDPREPGETRGASAVGNYATAKAPCLCVSGDDHDSREDKAPFRLKEHGRLGAEYAKQRNDFISAKQSTYKYRYSAASEIGASAAQKVTGCDKDCIKAQLDAAHKTMGVNQNDELRVSSQKADVPELLPPGSTPSV